jgi:hypothetical protein
MTETFSRWLLRQECRAVRSVGMDLPMCAALDDEAGVELAARVMAGQIDFAAPDPHDPEAARIEAAARAMLGIAPKGAKNP